MGISTKMNSNKNTLDVKITKSFPAQRNIYVKKPSQESVVSTAYESEMTLSVTPRSRNRTKSPTKIKGFHKTMNCLSTSKSKSPSSSRSVSRIRSPYLINGELPNYLRTTHLVRIRSKDPNKFEDSIRTHRSTKNVLGIPKTMSS